MTLHHPGFDARYCGPTALCAVSGCDYATVREYINTVRNRPPNQAVLGMSVGDMALTLIKMGYRFVAMNMRTGYRPAPHGRGDAPVYPTLIEFMDTHGRKGTWIIEVTGHYMAVCDGLVSDTLARDPRPLRPIHKPKRRVKTAWLIENP